jgi:hypothetical protein
MSARCLLSTQSSIACLASRDAPKSRCTTAQSAPGSGTTPEGLNPVFKFVQIYSLTMKGFIILKIGDAFK